MSSDDDFNYEDADEESQNNLECRRKIYQWWNKCRSWSSNNSFASTLDQ